MTWYNERDRTWGLEADDVLGLVALGYALPVFGIGKLLSLFMSESNACTIAYAIWTAITAIGIVAYRRWDPSFRFRPPAGGSAAATETKEEVNGPD